MVSNAGRVNPARRRPASTACATPVPARRAARSARTPRATADSRAPASRSRSISHASFTIRPDSTTSTVGRTPPASPAAAGQVSPATRGASRQSDRRPRTRPGSRNRRSAQPASRRRSAPPARRGSGRPREPPELSADLDVAAVRDQDDPVAARCRTCTPSEPSNPVSQRTFGSRVTSSRSRPSVSSALRTVECLERAGPRAAAR